MKLAWKKDAKPEVILAKINAIRHRNEEGVSLGGWDLIEHSPMLESMLNFPPALLREDWSDIVIKGLLAAENHLDKNIIHISSYQLMVIIRFHQK